MGYQTVKKVPTLHDYDHAMRWWEMTKPIRGRSVDLRPLAERRHADTYSIRKNPSNNAIECVLYKTPVVAFMSDGEVQVSNGGWATASTHMFIEEVLGTGISVSGQRGKSIVRVNGVVFSLGGDEKLRLRTNGSKYEVINEQTHHDYKINRRGANIVRNRYKGFYDYLNGFLKLRAQETQGYHYGPMQMMVECAFTELADTFGTKDWGIGNTEYIVVHTDPWLALTRKPGTYQNYSRVPKEQYEETVQKFLDLIKSDQDEETKHLNFHKAALVLLTYNHASIIEERDNTVGRTVFLYSDKAKETLDTTLFKWYANEVLERYKVPKGKVPSNRYEGWLSQENT